MRQFYQRSVLALGVIACTMAVSAATYTCEPAQGTVNMEAYPSGLNSVEVLGKYTINRTAAGYISLYQDDVLLRQIPASNYASLYTYEGFDKTEVGNVHVTFYDASGPAKNPGVYKVTVPAGFFTTTSNEPTEAMEFSWTVPMQSLAVSPAPGKYTELKEFVFTLPTTVVSGRNSEDVASYALNSGVEITLTKLRDTEAQAIGSTVKLEGNIATVTLNEAVTEPDTYTLDVPEGAFTYTTVSNRKVSSMASTYVYDVVFDSKAGVDILPAPGEYSEFVAQTGEVDGNEFQYTFLLSVPEDNPIRFALMGQAKLCPMNSDGSYNASAPAASFRAVKKSATLLALVPSSGDVNQVVSVAPGKYALVVPAGLYSTTKGSNGEYFFEYTVVSGGSENYTIEPSADAGVPYVETVKIIFPEGSEVKCLSNSYATLTNGVAEYAMAPTVSDDEPNAVTFSLPAPMSDKGEWMFATPSYGFTVDGNVVSVVKTYTVTGSTGVSMVEAEGALEVYNLSGVKVAAGVDSTSLSSLPAGVYVTVGANGGVSKVVVK